MEVNLLRVQSSVQAKFTMYVHFSLIYILNFLNHAKDIKTG